MLQQNHKIKVEREDLALIRRAIHEGWKISPKKKSKFFEAIEELIHKCSDPNVKIKATDLVLKMERSNLENIDRLTEALKEQNTGSSSNEIKIIFDGEDNKIHPLQVTIKQASADFGKGIFQDES